MWIEFKNFSVKSIKDILIDYKIKKKKEPKKYLKEK